MSRVSPTRPAAILVGLALLCGSCTAAGPPATTKATPKPERPTRPPDLPRGVVAAVATEAGPNFLTPAGGSMWLTETDEGAVARIDPDSNEVAARTRVGDEPGFLTPGFGDAWLTSFASSRVWRLDAHTGAIVASARLPSAGYGLNPGFGSMWVAGHDTNELLELDPDDAHVAGHVRVPSPTDVVAGFGRLWVPSEDGHVYAIDPTALAVTAKIAAPAHAVAVGFGSVWASGGGDADTVTRIDPSTAGVVAKIDTEVAGFPDRMTAFRGRLWVGQFQSAHVLGIDPKTNEVADRLPAGSGAAVVASGFGGLWVANYDDDTVWRLKPR